MVAVSQTVTVLPAIDETKSIEIEEIDTVRAIGHGIAGAKITAKMNGPAKVALVNAVSDRVKERKSIGSGDVEYTVNPTGKGNVEPEVASVPPNGGSSSVTKFEFEAK